jgi:hypothetical protein
MANLALLFSPHKSRKNALKSRVPTKCNRSSMPIVDSGEIRKKIGAFTLNTDDDVINTLLGEPLVTLCLILNPALIENSLR